MIKNLINIKKTYIHNILNFIYIVNTFLTENKLDSKELLKILKNCEKISKSIYRKSHKNYSMFDLKDDLVDYAKYIENQFKNIEILLDDIDKDLESLSFSDIIFEVKHELYKFNEDITSLIINQNQTQNESKSINKFDDEYFQKVKNSKISNNCWIDKYGVIYNCNWHEHSLLADKIKERLYPDSIYSGEILYLII